MFYRSCVPYSSDSWVHLLNQPHFWTLDATGAPRGRGILQQCIEGLCHGAAAAVGGVGHDTAGVCRTASVMRRIIGSRFLTGCTFRSPMRNGDFIGLQWWFFMGFYISGSPYAKTHWIGTWTHTRAMNQLRSVGWSKKARAFWDKKQTKIRETYCRVLVCICGYTQTHQICTCTYMLLHVDVNIDRTFGKQKDSSNLTGWGVTFVGRHAREPHDQGKLQRQNGASMPTLRGDTLWLRPFCGSHDAQVSPRLPALFLPFLKH